MRAIGTTMRCNMLDFLLFVGLVYITFASGNIFFIVLFLLGVVVILSSSD
jgi:hypothetical protein